MQEHSCSISASQGRTGRFLPPTASFPSSLLTLSEKVSLFVTSSAISFFCYTLMRNNSNHTVSRLSFCLERSLIMSVFCRLVSEGGYFCNMRFIRSLDSVEKNRWIWLAWCPFDKMGIQKNRRPIADCMERNPKPECNNRWDNPRIDATLIATDSSEKTEITVLPLPTNHISDSSFFWTQWMLMEESK